ncbi:MAG: hypothetical protein L6Q69_20340 [Zoogloea sp.]|nr:hypothetical protein [Zoogloea sp.]
MASKAQFTGMTGSFLVAAQLSARNLVSSTTSRSAAGADILVTDERCLIAFSIQVKTNSKTAGFWILGKKEPSPGSKSHVYAFVNLIKDQNGDVTGDYYLVPSSIVKEVAKFGGEKWQNYSVYRSDIMQYRNNWGIFDVS